MIDLSRDGYSHQEIVDILHMRHGSRKIRFRYMLLNKDEEEIKDISKSVEGGRVEQSAFSEIKRTASLYIKDNKNINWYTDRIQVYVEFQGKKGWITFSLGVFLMSTPTKKEQKDGIYREVEAYDKLLILKEDKVTERYTINKNTRYYKAMTDLIISANENKYNIEDSGKVLNNDKEYPPGTEKLQILNELASDLNFTPFWVDEYGYYRSSRYISPQDRAADYIYVDDELSIIENGMEEELDLFDLPNVFNIVVSSPDDESLNLSAVAENNNPAHPRSIQNLGRRVVRYEEKDNIADQASLDAYVERIAFEASQIYGRVKFNTAIMPFHSYSDVLHVKNKVLNIDDKYSEVNWSIELSEGAMMSHEARKVVSLI